MMIISHKTIPIILLLSLIVSTTLSHAALLQKGAPSSAKADVNWTHFPWQSQLNRDHPLNGKIWSVRDKAFISPKTLIQKLKDHPYIGLGEIHDNPDHHILQAWIIEQITQHSARKPDIVMEMIDSAQQQALSTYLASKNPTASGLSKVLKWEKSGWPQWSLYAPIAQISLDAALTIRAGNPTKKLGKLVAKKGFDALGDSRKSALFLDRPLPDALAKDLKAQIVSGHCNMIPASATTPMVRVQRLRDAVMAQNLLKTDPAKAAILIAGGGHVRLDRGVAWYVRQAGKKMVSVMMAEAQEDELTDPLALISQAPKGHVIADYIWITPRTQREDPCKQFEKFMKRKGQHKLPAPQK